MTEVIELPLKKGRINFLNPRQLNKLNKLNILWVTECETCGDKNYKIVALHQQPGQNGQYIAECMCKKCATITKMVMDGDEFHDKLNEIERMEDKVIFERDEFVVKENEVEYFIEMKTDEGALELDRTSVYGRVIGAVIPKSKIKGRGIDGTKERESLGI